MNAYDQSQPFRPSGRSFGSARDAASRVVERMLTVSESLRAQGRSNLGFLVAALHAHACQRSAPSLLPSA